MRPISKNRLRKIASGDVKLNGKSTFKRMSAEEFRQAQGQERKEMMAALSGKSTLKKRSPRQIAKDRAWDQFSLFIRLRDSDEHGIIKCCTCPRRAHWKRMQAGHYVTRKKEATLFDEHCVHGQCAGCNRWQGGKPIEYEQFLERKYGKGTAEGLRIKAVTECKRDLEDYRFLEDTYKKRVAWIKQHEPGKFLGEVDPAHILQLLPDALS